MAAVGLDFIRVLETNTVMERCFSSSPAIPSFFFSARISLVLALAFYRLQEELVRDKAINVKEEGKCLTFSLNLFLLLVYRSCAGLR